MLARLVQEYIKETHKKQMQLEEEWHKSLHVEAVSMLKCKITQELLLWLPAQEPGSRSVWIDVTPKIQINLDLHKFSMMYK